jgi:hypothetical protein
MNIEKVEQEAQASSISARYKNHRILIANGIGNDPKKGRMQAILRDFEAMGADSELLMTDAYGTLLENSQLLENQIDTFLAKGQNLILVGTSKSIVELIGALARLAPKLEGNERPPGYGKIEALVSISGLMQGSVLADWLDRQWGTNLFNGVVNLLAKLSDQYSLKAIASYRIMNSNSLTEWYQEYAPRIPKSVLYVNLIGITPGDGIAKDSFLNQLQTYLVRPAILDYGAYDGYVEYPGSSMPNEWAPKIVRLTVDSSHSLLDGSFRDLPLDQESSRRTFFAGLFHSIADLAW